ncbi:DUF742 domain-containing protein [Nocardia sp. NPDC059239]|uniref:DUF742 domain-containing protein n=1 Tax=unclassified Nocardia TaxID=2637762 RepID=UPI00369BB177
MKFDEEDSGFAADPGPLVRPFAVTRGRVGRDAHELDMITLIIAVRPESDAVLMDKEYGQILRMCQGRPLTIAEIAAEMNLLLAAIKVLVSDLIGSGHLIYRSPMLTTTMPDVKILQAVLDGVRKL